jgi:hypothetical protein
MSMHEPPRKRLVGDGEALAAMLGDPIADPARPPPPVGRGGAVLDRTVRTCFSLGVASLRGDRGQPTGRHELRIVHSRIAGDFA